MAVIDGANNAQIARIIEMVIVESSFIMIFSFLHLIGKLYQRNNYATLGTVIGSGEINQIAPYARRQYYEHKEKSYWFERMKNRHKDSILKGAAQYVKNH